MATRCRIGTVSDAVIRERSVEEHEFDLVFAAITTRCAATKFPTRNVWSFIGLVGEVNRRPGGAIRTAIRDYVDHPEATVIVPSPKLVRG